MNISQKTIIDGESFFHPRATIVKDKLFMTLQTISGSDYFGPVQSSVSLDKGQSWTKTEFISGMGWIPVADGIEEGICDVVPDYHPFTGKILAIGHNVYYKGGRLYDSLGDFHPENGPRLKRFPVYTVCNDAGQWSGTRRKLEFPEFENYGIYSCNCSQKVILSNGKMLIPITFGDHCRSVTSFLCDFDGESLSVVKRGNILKNNVGRGLLEPSMTEYAGKYYMTIRAEDERGYVSTSNDGLNWQDIKTWQWDDGEPLFMSTTQQHWLTLGEKLYLIYTRKSEGNAKVMRWRSPLWISEVDREKLCLKRHSEQVVFPMRGKPDQPETVPLMGNFHPLAILENEAIVTVGEMLPHCGYKGNTLLARLKV
jgi:hypothetical protein